MRRLFTLMASCLVAQPVLAAQVTDYMLDNGLQVVVIEDNRAPVAVQMLWYKAGSADEPPGKSGIAHYLEHLMFKGTDTRAPGEFSEIVAANGGTDNAFTSYDYTGYFQRVAADRLELVMEMEADRMRNLQLNDRDILTERDVVLEERKQRVDSDPSSLFREQRAAALYLNHPYGRPIIGWEHEIESLSLEDAIDFYETFYAPNNAVLIVAGDVVPEDVYALAQKYYGPIAPTPGLGERVRPTEPPQLAERRLVLEDPRTSEPIMIRTYLAPERDPGAQTEAAALTLLSRILGGNLATSVLGQKLVFEADKAVFTSAYYRGTSYDDTEFGVYVVPKPGVSLEDAEAALDDAIAAFLEEGIDPDQFARIKMRLRASEIYAQDSTQGLARRYGAALMAGLTLSDIEAWPRILQETTAEDVMAAAERLFDRRKAVTGWEIAPQNETSEVTQ